MKKYALIALLSFFGGWFAGTYTAPSPSGTQTVYVDREVPKEVFKEVPVVEYKYKEIPVEKLRVDTIYVPKNMPEYGLVDPDRAIRIKNDKVQLKYYNVEERRYQVDEFLIPRRPFGIRVAGLVDHDFAVPAFGALAEARYDRWRLGAAIKTTDFKTPQYNISLQYDIIR